MNKDDVLKIVCNVIDDYGKENNKQNLKNPAKSTILYGRDGNLDSLGLVGIVLGIENEIFDKYGVEIVIADERAMSQTRSPFRDVEALTDYILDLIKEKK